MYRNREQELLLQVWGQPTVAEEPNLAFGKESFVGIQFHPVFYVLFLVAFTLQ